MPIVYYREVQRMTRWWLLLIILGVSALMWYEFIVQTVLGKPFGTNPMPDPMMIVFVIIFGIILPTFFMAMRLTCAVKKDGLYVRVFPFHLHPHCFEWGEISSCKVMTYRPIVRFGGWGIRTDLRGNKAYTVSGNRGIEILLRSGKVIVIGSRHAATLKKAMGQARIDSSK
ncbi:DUF6141 family protein [Sporolactobacillus shoreicorticis]|uniref:DUF6141 family protein n=1 Tax=Sporolactobacillus shoreicorticis TaxID=1923877 RepID=A0ABW5S1P4_9BACL|nr:DUF6141 family protein [Sporolactobacillus shoreicorticis]MCO7126445.1 DUF6141 family protein [Sporolactobacillus shoreicorticis]